MISIHKQPMFGSDYRSHLSIAASITALARWRSASMMRLLILFILLFGNVAEPKPHGTYFRPEQRRTDEYRSFLSRMDLSTLFMGTYMLQDSTTTWSEPLQLFQAMGAGEIHEPFVVTDSYGSVHVFWTVVNSNQDDLTLIYYARLDATGWTSPVDIIASSTARAVRATIGQDNFIYLIWYGDGGIQYSRAPVRDAEFVHSWSSPYLITAANTHAGIATSGSGLIYLAFPGKENSGIFKQELNPQSLSWSSPTIISWNSLINTAADYAELKIDMNGTLHVVWTEFYYPESWPPRGVFYSQSVDGGENWIPPTLLGGDGFDQINLLVLDDNNIHVAWNGMAGVGGRYHRWSSDGGMTWSEPVDAISSGTGGTEGAPQILTDQSGTLHMLTTFNGCAWYLHFKSQRWSAPICISGEQARASNYIEEPALGLSDGNKLHAVFWDDRKRLWYTAKTTDAEWIAPQTAPTNDFIQAVQNPTKGQSMESTAIPIATSPLSGSQLGSPSKFNPNPGQVLMFSLLPVIVLVGAIVILILSKKTR